MGSNNFKIFEVDDGETTWVAADSIQSAIKCYEDEIDEVNPSLVKELSLTEAKEIKINFDGYEVNLKTLAQSILMKGEDELPFVLGSTMFN